MRDLAAHPDRCATTSCQEYLKYSAVQDEVCHGIRGLRVVTKRALRAPNVHTALAFTAKRRRRQPECCRTPENFLINGYLRSRNWDTGIYQREILFLPTCRFLIHANINTRLFAPQWEGRRVREREIAVEEKEEEEEEKEKEEEEEEKDKEKFCSLVCYYIRVKIYRCNWCSFEKEKYTFDILISIRRLNKISLKSSAIYI